MLALLDTHVLLWWSVGDPRLSERSKSFLADPANRLLWSVASTWEAAIKSSLGRLSVAEGLDRFVARYLSQQGIESLPITNAHAIRTAALPHLHADPFDRMLVAQAQSEGVPLLSGDGQIARYDVEVIW